MAQIFRTFAIGIAEKSINNYIKLGYKITHLTPDGYNLHVVFEEDNAEIEKEQQSLVSNSLTTSVT